jgi:hypothetical protein
VALAPFWTELFVLARAATLLLTWLLSWLALLLLAAAALLTRFLGALLTLL